MNSIEERMTSLATWMRGRSWPAATLLTMTAVGFCGCADFALTPRIEPGFWEAPERVVSVVDLPLPPARFAGEGDVDTFEFFNVDKEAEEAVKCAQSHLLDVTAARKEFEDLLRSRGFSVEAAATESQRQPFVQLLPPYAGGTPVPEPAARGYAYSTTAAWWGVTRTYIFAARRPLQARVDLVTAIYDPRAAAMIWKGQTTATAPVGDETDCGAVVAALAEAQRRAAATALERMSRWDGRHRMGFTISSR